MMKLLLWSSSTDIIAEVVKEVNAGSDRKVSDYAVDDDCEAAQLQTL